MFREAYINTFPTHRVIEYRAAVLVFSTPELPPTFVST
jgi:hypothetical protein